MRRLAFFSGMTMTMVVGGCVLLDRYEYSGYGGSGGSTPESTSGSTTSTTSSSNSSSGNGGSGCAPEVCNYSQDLSCYPGDDCIVNADWSGRYGKDEDGDIFRALAITVRPGGGTVIGGEHDGILSFLAGAQPSPAAAPVPFVAAFDDKGANLFYKVVMPKDPLIKKPGSVLRMASAGAYIFVGGIIEDATGSIGKTVFVTRLSATTGNVDNSSTPFTNFVYGTAAKHKVMAMGIDGTHLFVGANFTGTINPPCPATIMLETTDSEGVVLDIDLTTGTCVRAFSVADTTITGLTFVGAQSDRRVIVTGFEPRSVVIDAGVPDAEADAGAQMENYTSSMVAAYSTTTGVKIWSNDYEPKNKSGILGLVDVTSDGTNAYVTGTLHGTWEAETADLVHPSGAEGFDAVVASVRGTDGAMNWAHRYGGLAWQQPFSIVRSESNLYMAGITNKGMAVNLDTDQGPLCENVSGQAGCIFLLKMTLDGKSVWGRAFGIDTSLDNRSARIALDGTSLWLGGTWAGSVNFGDNTGYDQIKIPNIVLTKFPSLP